MKRKYTKDEAISMVARAAKSAPTDFGLDQIMDGLMELIVSAGDRLTEEEMGFLVASAAVLCKQSVKAKMAAAGVRFQIIGQQ